MITEGGRVLAAVSGGLDSMVMLHALAQLSGIVGFSLVVGHVNHNLRGEESLLDAALVEKAAQQLGLSFQLMTLEASDLEQHRGFGREGAARMVRRQALSSIAAEMEADRIALAHTLEDRAETLLFNLTRGVGGRGIAAMPPVNLPFIRPLLESRRVDVLAYARMHTIEWREDASNSDSAFSRNRIRHHVLPELRRINPEADATIIRSAGILAELSDAADALALDWVNARFDESNDTRKTMRLSGFEELPPGAGRLVLRAAIHHAAGSLLRISAAHVDALYNMATSDSGHASCSLPNLTVRKSGDWLEFHSEVAGPQAFEPLDVSLGTTDVKALGIKFHLETLPRSDALDQEFREQGSDTELIDADRVSLPLQLRIRKPGDRFIPLGLQQPVKLKSLLINEHVSYFDRDRLPLLCSNDQIVWVVGIRISDTVKITPSTKRVLRVQVEEMPCS